jgi:hypothetical protein
MLSKMNLIVDSGQNISSTTLFQKRRLEIQVMMDQEGLVKALKTGTIHWLRTSDLILE